MPGKKKGELTALGLAGGVFGVAVLALEFLGSYPGYRVLVPILGLVIGIWMVANAGKRGYAKNERAWLFAAAALFNFAALIVYIIKRKKTTGRKK
jgi:hypothetical protein